MARPENPTLDVADRTNMNSPEKGVTFPLKIWFAVMTYWERVFLLKNLNPLQSCIGLQLRMSTDDIARAGPKSCDSDVIVVILAAVISRVKLSCVSVYQ